MKIRVKVSETGVPLMQAGAATTVVDINAQDYEMGQATVAVLNILQAHGIGQVSDGDEDSVGTTSESEPVVDLYGSGDVVRLIFDDDSSRLFVYTGTYYYSPPVEGKYPDAMTVKDGDDSVKWPAEVVAREWGH